MTGDLRMDNNVIYGPSQIQMRGDIFINNNRIYSLPNATGTQQPVTLGLGDNRYLKLDGSKSKTGNLDMGDKTIIRIRRSSQDNAALIVGGAKATYLDLTARHSMKGNLDMGGFNIKNIKPFVEDPNIQQDTDVISFGYFKAQRTNILLDLSNYAVDYLSRKNPLPMGKNTLIWEKNSIVNLKDPQPSDSTYAATVNFVNKTINDSNSMLSTLMDTKMEASETASIKTVGQQNVFEKVMADDLFKEDDEDIHKVGIVDKDFHKVNQQTYLFRFGYDSKIGYYSTRLSIDVVYLPISYYTMVFELYFSNKIDPDEIIINAQRGTLSVSKINSKISSDHTRSVINFYKAIVYPSLDDLDIDIS